MIFELTTLVLFDGVTHMRAIAYMEEMSADIHGDATAHVAAYRYAQADALAVFACNADRSAECITYEGNASAHEYAWQVHLFDVVAECFGLWGEL